MYSLDADFRSDWTPEVGALNSHSSTGPYQFHYRHHAKYRAFSLNGIRGGEYTGQANLGHWFQFHMAFL
jgi:hypothetical protein